MNKETIHAWLQQNNWLILDDFSNNVEALSPLGLIIHFHFNSTGEYHSYDNTIEICKGVER